VESPAVVTACRLRSVNRVPYRCFMGSVAFPPYKRGDQLWTIVGWVVFGLWR